MRENVDLGKKRSLTPHRNGETIFRKEKSPTVNAICYVQPVLLAHGFTKIHEYGNRAG